MELIELFKAAIIGIVQGITEWLPISSTGHMIIADEFIQLNVSPDFMKIFLVVIQLGSIMAVIVLYFKRLNPFASSKNKEGRKRTWWLWLKVAVACIPAAIVGLLLDNWFEENFYNAITVALALVLYGVAFIIVERFKGADKPLEKATVPDVSNEPTAYVGKHSAAALAAQSITAKTAPPSRKTAPAKRRPASKQPHKQNNEVVAEVDNLSFARALGIGLFQCLAIVPGTSRSGATILGGRILGVSRAAAAEFSFFLAIPVMFGWSLLRTFKAFVLDGIVLTNTEWGVFTVGVIVAFLVSILAIKFLMEYIRKHSFEIFGWYRIVLGIVVLGFFALSGQLFIVQ
ncbi:MAG: undecaprenyl-diphosphate phosphatase [Coriobacteriales bacterium]|jgi:undecaprenyl-diphosphatase|nr:undecaprenyl-diphosphate phosphatase [Coriobacteriales bacterium]